MQILKKWKKIVYWKQLFGLVTAKQARFVKKIIVLKKINQREVSLVLESSFIFMFSFITNKSVSWLGSDFHTILIQEPFVNVSSTIYWPRWL